MGGTKSTLKSQTKIIPGRPPGNRSIEGWCPLRLSCYRQSVLWHGCDRDARPSEGDQHHSPTRQVCLPRLDDGLLRDFERACKAALDRPSAPRRSGASVAKVPCPTWTCCSICAKPLALLNHHVDSFMRICPQKRHILWLALDLTYIGAERTYTCKYHMQKVGR